MLGLDVLRWSPEVLDQTTQPPHLWLDDWHLWDQYDWCSILLLLPGTCHFFGKGWSILDLEIETFWGIFQPANLLGTRQCSDMLDEGERGIELFQLLLLCGPTLPVVDGIAGGEETFSLTPGQSEKTSKTEKHLYRLVFTKIITSLKSQSNGNLQHSFLLNVTQPLKVKNSSVKPKQDAWLMICTTCTTCTASLPDAHEHSREGTPWSPAGDPRETKFFFTIIFVLFLLLCWKMTLPTECRLKSLCYQFVMLSASPKKSIFKGKTPKPLDPPNTATV